MTIVAFEVGLWMKEGFCSHLRFLLLIEANCGLQLCLYLGRQCFNNLPAQSKPSMIFLGKGKAVMTGLKISTTLSV